MNDVLLQIDKIYPGLGKSWQEKEKQEISFITEEKKSILLNTLTMLTKGVHMKQRLDSSEFDEAHWNTLKEQLQGFVKDQLKAKLPFARAETIGHGLAYADLYTRDGHIIPLPNDNFEPMNFEVKGVIRNDVGLCMAMMKPVGPIPEDQEVIPIMVTFRGTDDGHSLFIRDTDPLGAGTGAFNPDGPYLVTMLNELNTTIGELKKKYPNKRFSIQTYGHHFRRAVPIILAWR